jgi:hypothetical protein
MTQTTDERIRELLLDSLNILDGTFRSTQATDIASQIAAEIDALRDELAVILRERNDAHLALAEARANLRLAAMRIEGFIAAKDDALAEIDGLRAQLSTQADEMIRFTNLANDYATVSQKLAGCESALRLSLAGTEQHYFASPARIDDVRAALAERTRERDEARAELAGLDAGMRFQFDRAEDYKAQRDEARAELLKEREAYSKRAAEQTVSGASKLMIAELAEARAEVERLRPAAEAWEADQYYGNLLWSLPIERDTAQEEKLQRAATRRRDTNDAAHAAARQSDARARAAKGAK